MGNQLYPATENSSPDAREKNLPEECSLGVASILMGAWRGEDLNQISKEKRHW
jgi:hypothetical protein